MDRTAPVTLWGPRPARRTLSLFVNLGVERMKFPVEIREVTPGERIERGEYEIVAFPAEHRAESIGYALVERDRLGRFDPERARELGIPEGPLWGRIHRGEAVTLDDGRVVQPSELVGPRRPGRTVVYTGDTRPCDSVVAAARDADLIVHEATFGEEERDRAKETGHSTAAEAAGVALRAGARSLVLTHISPRYLRDAPELLAEARAVFPGTTIARDGLTIDVPFRDAPPG
jgi:ribonuclease Z